MLDYLVEEVLRQQPEHVQSFLLRTSILDRLCGPLCDAVLRDLPGSGQATLNVIENANLFIVPLDNERRWYRYHHLFADLLRQRAGLFGAAARQEIAEAHTRASIWYEAHGLEIEAFQHAAGANDLERAERLIEGAGMPLYFRGAAAPVLNWLASLPAAVLDARPALWVAYVTALTFAGKQTVNQKLQAAEVALRGAEPGGTTPNLLGHIAALQAMLAIPQHDVATIIAQARRALAYLHRDNLPIRTIATWALGYAYQLQGDRAVEATGSPQEWLTTLVLQTIALQAHGEQDQALQVLAEALARAEPQGCIRIFVDEGASMARLLTAMQDTGGPMHDYVHALLVACGAQPEALPSSLHAQSLAEPLSQRELEVLRLVSQGLSNRAIGARLVLALDTVKGHNRRIYDKLQVQRRTEAVARARELGLL